MSLTVHTAEEIIHGIIASNPHATNQELFLLIRGIIIELDDDEIIEEFNRVLVKMN